MMTTARRVFRTLMQWSAVCLLLGSALSARAVYMVHDFYLPMPEAQIRASMTSMEAKIGTTMDSVFSIVVTGPDTIIHYDHWEDGYETDINNPVQSTTEIWGDGNDATGIPPGYDHDPDGLPIGAVIALRNLVSLPRKPSSILYDARDRVTASKAIVVSRAAWATSPGPMFAGAVDVNATIDYGTSFISPVGEDVNAAQMFEYCALFVMASENNTVVTIDTDGPGGLAPVTVTLNRGESYHIDGGVMKGATVTATKPVQTQLFTGDKGARYESRWYTLYPVEDWYSSYVTPVGSAANGQSTYIFVYNPNTEPITINTASRVGAGSFSVAPGDSYQWLVPRNSGARLTNPDGNLFFALATVGASPSANNVYDWGFTLVPEDGLTTLAVVGWGPGSSDGTKNGSPVWVSPLADTLIYVDYNGDGEGALTDPNGNKYDEWVQVSALESKTIYDPDGDQTAMRLYTLDGTLFATAWGQDPMTAGSGNPYLDLGTTVLPMPTPVLRKSNRLFEDNTPEGLSIGDVLEYRIEVNNKGLLPLGNTIVLDTLPVQLEYVTDSTTYNGEPLADNTTGLTLFPLDETGYTIPIILRGGSSVFTYRTKIVAAGTIQNTASKPQYELEVENEVEVPAAAGSHPCEIKFTNADGTLVSVYWVDSPIYLSFSDPDANLDPNAIDTLTVLVRNETTGDVEPLVLTETSANSGVFVSLAPLPSSTAAGLDPEDGTLYAQAGDSLSVSYIDPLYGDACSASAVVASASKIKPLYLTTDGTDGDLTGALDRIDPVASGDTTTSQTAILLPPTPTTVAFTTPGTQQWTVPAGVNHITIASWGGGGAGGGKVTFSYGSGGGGGGGAYALSSVDVTPGETLTVSVAGSASGTTGNGADGSPSSVMNSLDEVLVHAAGGAGGTSSGGGGAGGTVATSIGDTKYAGGNGADGGAGGGGAGTIGAGGNANGITAGTGTSIDGGNGGAGRTNNGNGNNGAVFGGGGSGAQRSFLTSTYSGGNGAAGQVTISYSTGAAAIFTQTPTFCSDFVMPSGGALSIRNYVRVSQSLLSANPAITAKLAVGATEVVTLTSPTATLLSGGQATVTHAATTSVGSGSGNVTSLTLAHTPGTGRDRLLLVAVGVGATTDTGNPPNATGATFGGTALTLLGSQVSGSGSAADDTISYLYYMVNPPSGSANVVVSLSGSGTLAVGATTFTGVDQSNPLGTLAKASSTSGTASVNVSSAIGELVFGTVSWDEQPTLTVGAGQSTRWNIPGGKSGAVSAAASTQPGAASVTHTYTSNNTQDWALLAVSIKPAIEEAIYQLDWSTALGSEVTLPAGSALKLTVDNGEDAGFSLLYDSTTYPARINLPASTVIKVDELKVYDAPYPSGNPVDTVVAGATVYIRTTVSDPFGAYDITGLDVSIPSAGVSTALTDSSVVNATACSKAYEYAWKPAGEGSYPIAVTAHEGTEGIIDSAATTLNVTFLDLGTPSITEFTVGNNGSRTNVYEPDQTVCIRVTDLDQNLDPAVVETVIVTVVTASGDTETVTLMETGPDTGIFTSCIPANATEIGGDQDGKLYLPPGTVLEVSYVDIHDPTDTSGDTALVPLPPGTPDTPSIAVTKTLVSPEDGQAIVGEEVCYRINVVNTGNTDLPSVSLTDSYSGDHLTYKMALPPPTTVDNGTLIWSNIGPLSPGKKKTFTVCFTALAPSLAATNTVVTDAGGGVTGTGMAAVRITQPAHTVTKTLVSPNPGSANYGDTVVFHITVKNTGDTTITTLPLEDTFSSAYLTFVSATLPPDETGSGSVLWENLAGAGLAPGASISFETTFTAIGGGSPALNTASAIYSVDEFGDDVPSARSVAEIVTKAASITGTVWNDVNQNATNDLDEVGIKGVTVQLFAIPDGGGDPVLVEVTTTSADGSYEFMNLPLGKYEVVQTDLPGYASSGDIDGVNDNKVAINIDVSTAYEHNDFYDYFMEPASYASLAGTVWHDTNANATNDLDEVGIRGVTVALIADLNGNGIADPGEPTVAVTQTDASGAYSFGALSSGSYVVIESDLPGYISTGDVDGANDNQIGVTLDAGQNVTNRDFFDTRPARLYGYAYQDKDEVLMRTDTSGAASGMVVQVWLDGVQVASTNANSDGYYTFDNLVPGTYEVRFIGNTTALTAIPVEGAAASDPERNRAEPVGQDYAVVTYTITSGHGIGEDKGEPINAGFKGGGPMSSGIDLRAYQGADGVYVEFVAYDVEENGTIRLYLLGPDGQPIWGGEADVQAGPRQISRFLVPGLTLGGSYNFGVRDEVGKFWQTSGVTVKPFAAEMISLSLAGVTLAFESLPDRTYEIQWTARLGTAWQTVTNVPSQGERTTTVVAHPDPTSPSGFFRIHLK